MTVALAAGTALAVTAVAADSVTQGNNTAAATNGQTTAPTSSLSPDPKKTPQATPTSTPSQQLCDPGLHLSCLNIYRGTQTNKTAVNNSAAVKGSGDVGNVNVDQSHNNVNGVSTQTASSNQSCGGPTITCGNVFISTQKNSTEVNNSATIAGGGSVDNANIDQSNNDVNSVNTQIATTNQSCGTALTCANFAMMTQENSTGVTNEANVIAGGDPSASADPSITNTNINQGDNTVNSVSTQIATANQSCGVALTCINVFRPVQINQTFVKNTANVIEQAPAVPTAAVAQVAPAVQVVPVAATPPVQVPSGFVPTVVAAPVGGGVGLPATGSAVSRISSSLRPGDAGVLQPQLIAGLLLLMAGLGLFVHQKVSRQNMHRKLA